MVNKKSGFTLVELLAVIVVLAILALLAIATTMPMMNRAKKNAFAVEASAYIKAAKQAYTVGNMDDLTSACYDISYLNETYVMKDDNDYTGMVIVSGPVDDVSFAISLSNGSYYVVKSGTGKITVDDVTKTKPGNFSSSCGNYNPVLSLDEINTNSLAYKLLMANGKSTLEANMADIDSRTASVNFSEIADTAAKSGMFKTQDDDGASYYYRGIINNNWVNFAGFYWHIIRINGDGSIRMIYSGLPDSNHTGANAAVFNLGYADTTKYNVSTLDVTGLTNTQVVTQYYNGVFANTYVGYMFNPLKIISSNPTYALDNTHKLNTFLTFTNINNANEYYLFKNFDPTTDCFVGDGDQGTCTLKCKKLGDDCILTNWNTQATTAGNYSTSAAGATTSNYVYTSPYKYSCWGYGTAVTKANSDNSTSVYFSCPLVTEIVGTVKDKPTQLKVRYIGLFSPDKNESNRNVMDNKVKIYIERWYRDNIYNKKDASDKYYEEYIADEIFCNDRTPALANLAFPLTAGGHYYYSPYYRLQANKNPSLKCPDKANDAFTLSNGSTNSIVTSKGNGNGMLNYPVGLITGDEVALAGALFGTNSPNTNHYLYTGANYWTMSPHIFDQANGISRVQFVHSTTGSISYNNTNASYGIRPVINLSPSVLYDSGNGTETNPYTIKLQ